MNDLISSLLIRAASEGAADLFLSAGKPPSFRLQGRIATDARAPVPNDETLRSFRLSVIGEAGERRYLETGSFDASCTLEGRFRFRINFFRTCRGSAMAVRPVRNGSEMEFSKLHLPEIAASLSDAPRGLILVAGATGSGKSTTLAAMVNHINRHFRKHILTIEDPIEFIHEDILSLVSQRELMSDTVSFSDALRSALRENPDVIVIGEMRDAETVRTALGAALTGHLVLSTVHTADSIQAVERIIHLFPEDRRAQTAADLSLALNGILAQRLIPSQEGGMIPAVEILLGTPSVKKFIAGRDFRSLEDALQRGSASGMIPFSRAVFRLYKKGLVSLEDARAAATVREEFDLLVKGMESGVDAFRNHYGADCEEGSFVDMKSLLRAALRNGASDMILSCGTSPAIRLDGALVPFDLPAMNERDIEHLLFGIISQRQRGELEEKRELDFALAVNFTDRDGKSERARFRINGFYQRGTLGVVARIVNAAIPDPETLKLPKAVVDLTDKRQGLVLVTGPTGSGKSTTLASLIDRINRTRQAHIITIEDPIEYVHENKKAIVEQRELHADTLSFASALKYVLRQNPDVIMVGEMRDVETMSAALTAAETGHLVFATIHTNSAPQTVERIVDSFPVAHQNQIRLQLADVLLGVVSQRLLPRADGKGRIAAFEVMIGTPPVQANIREGKSYQLQSVIETGGKDGMITLEKYLEELYGQGLVSRHEIGRYKVDCKPIRSF